MTRGIPVRSLVTLTVVQALSIEERLDGWKTVYAG